MNLDLKMNRYKTGPMGFESYKVYGTVILINLSMEEVG